MKLLTIGDSSYKIAKSDKVSDIYRSAIVYLAPHKLSGYNVCPHASAGCIATCLNTSGLGQMNSVQKSRIAKTRFFYENREEFKKQLFKEIWFFVQKCRKNGKIAAIRLNGLSDLPWEKLYPELFNYFSDIIFYDYTKNFKRMMEFISGKFPVNYHLTFSRSEVNERQALEVAKYGGNVAVVFEKIPYTWNGFTVENADEDDLRFIDKDGTIQGLTPKGKAKKDKSGFVVRT